MPGPALHAQQKFGEAINTGALDLLHGLVSPDCVDHDPAPGQPAGAPGYMAVFTELRQAFPDMHVEVEHVVELGDDVAFAYTLTGTHDGDFMGHLPTGKPVKVRGLQISTFKDGQLVERWGMSDQLGILQQIGVVA